MRDNNTSIYREAFSVDEVLKKLGITRPLLYKEINDGRLRTFKIGRRRLVSASALDDYIHSREKEAAA